MAKSSDDIFEPDDPDRDEFDRLSDLLFLRISEFVEEEQVSDDVLSLMLLHVTITTRMMAYVVAVDKPSGFGLKLDLDRFLRDVDEAVRDMKKRADDYVIQAKETLAQVAAEDPEPT